MSRDCLSRMYEISGRWIFGRQCTNYEQLLCVMEVSDTNRIGVLGMKIQKFCCLRS